MELEKEILEAKEKIQFYHAKMQEIVSILIITYLKFSVLFSCLSMCWTRNINPEIWPSTPCPLGDRLGVIPLVEFPGDVLQTMFSLYELLSHYWPNKWHTRSYIATNRVSKE